MVATGRRTQAERREATRAELLTAALDCLVEAGMSGFTTTEVCRRAGLSQGALFKHFASKSALLAATTQHLFEQLRADFLSTFTATTVTRRSARQGLNLLWEQMFDPRLGAAFELYTIARTDSELQDALGPVVREHLASIQLMASTLLQGEDQAKLHDIVEMVTLAIQGLVIDQMALPDEAQRQRLRRSLEQLTQLLFPAD